MVDPYTEIAGTDFLKIRDRISNLDLKKSSTDEIFEIMKPLLGGLSATAIETPPNWALYRGVKWDSRPETVDKISYPPKEFAKINRASQQGEPLFYSSSSKNICLYEMNAKEGDMIAISQWATQVPLVFPLVGYTQNNINNMGGNRTIDWGEDWEYADEKFSKKTPYQIEVMEYLSGLFCQQILPNDEEKYKLTTAIAKLFYTGQYRDSLKQDGRFHGIGYPSIKGLGEHDNYALHVDLIDNNFLKFQNVEYIEVIKYDAESDKYQYKIIGYADSTVKNNIAWKKMNNTWTIWDDQEIYFHENSPMRAFKDNGEEYPWD